VRTHGVPELREAVQAGGISLAAAADIAQLPPEEQRERLATERAAEDLSWLDKPVRKPPGVICAHDDLRALKESFALLDFHCRQVTAAVKLAQLRQEKQQTPKPGDWEPADLLLPLQEALAKHKTAVEALTRRIKRVDPRLPKRPVPFGNNQGAIVRPAALVPQRREEP
jgi:hypothetical protein